MPIVLADHSEIPIILGRMKEVLNYLLTKFQIQKITKLEKYLVGLQDEAKAVEEHMAGTKDEKLQRNKLGTPGSIRVVADIRTFEALV